MKEAYHVTIGDKRVGCVIDRNRQQVWIDDYASNFGSVKSVVIDGSEFQINYKAEPDLIYNDWGGPNYCCLGNPHLVYDTKTNQIVRMDNELGQLLQACDTLDGLDQMLKYITDQMRKAGFLGS